MPRVKLNTPPVDRLKGMILERQAALGLSNAALADKLGLSRQSWWVKFKKPTSEWRLADIEYICRVLGIPKEEWRMAI